MWKTLLGWSAAVVTTAVSGSVVQSQINLAAISRLDQSIAVSDRLDMTLFDLGSFGPLWGAIVAFAFLLAWPIAGLLARKWLTWRWFLFPLAGFVAIICALLVMNAAMPVTVVAAARTVPGMVMLGLCGALGGWVYLQVAGAAARQRQKGQI